MQLENKFIDHEEFKNMLNELLVGYQREVNVDEKTARKRISELFKNILPAYFVYDRIKLYSITNDPLLLWDAIEFCAMTDQKIPKEIIVYLSKVAKKLRLLAEESKDDIGYQLMEALEFTGGKGITKNVLSIKKFGVYSYTQLLRMKDKELPKGARLLDSYPTGVSIFDIVAKNFGIATSTAKTYFYEMKKLVEVSDTDEKC